MISTSISPKIGNAMVATQERVKNQPKGGQKRPKYNRAQLLRPFYQALDIIREKKQWSSGHQEVVSGGTLAGRNSQIYIRNEGGRLALRLWRQASPANPNEAFFSKPFPLAMLNSELGCWEISTRATEENYLKWNKETREEIYK